MEIQGAVANFTTANVTLVTTAEGVAIVTPLLRVNRNSAIVMIAAWCNLLTGAGTTSVIPAIRRGDLVTSPLVTEANNVVIGAAAGSNEQFQIIAFEQLTSEQVVQYNLSVAQNGATGNGTIASSGIFAIAV